MGAQLNGVLPAENGSGLRKEQVYLAIILVAFSYYISYFNYGINLGDEGFFVYGAARVLQGQLPMSDFISYPPGSYFLLALLFKMFGVNLLVSRLMEMAFLLFNGVMMFFIGKRLMPRPMALIPAFLLIGFPGPWYKVFFTFGLLLPLVSLYRFLEKRSTLRIVTIGWCLGIALVFKFESFLCSFVTSLFVLFAAHAWEREDFFVDGRRVKAFLKDVSFSWLGLLCVALPFIVYYQWNSDLSALFLSFKESYARSNIEAAGGFFDKPSIVGAITNFHIGSLQHQFFSLIVLLYLFVFCKLIVHFFMKKKREFPVLLPVLMMGVLSLSYAYANFDKSHLLQSAAMAYLLFGFVLHSTTEGRSTKSKIGLIVLLSLLCLYILDNYKMRAYFHSGSIRRLYVINREGRNLFSSRKGSVYVEKRQWDTLDSLLRFFEGKKGYLLPLHYDPMVNFLTGLENPTKYSILFPSFFGATGRQEKVVADIERFDIKYLLIPRLLMTNEGSFKFSDYAPVLYEYVREKYPFERGVGYYLVFSRQPL
jgi:hypothetical protein